MRDELYEYYEQELTSFHDLSMEFAAKYPKIAGRLHLNESRDGADPHVERLIQSFALLTSRIRRKIDSEFPEVVESLLDLIYPHYLRPVPSMAVAQFRYDPKAAIGASSVVPSKTEVFSTTTSAQRCIFRTVYPTTIWPLRVSNASLGSVAGLPESIAVPPEAAFALRIQLEVVGNVPGTLQIPELRFFLNGKGSPLYLLYELLFAHTINVHLKPITPNPDSVGVWLGPDSIRPVGFDAAEGLLPYSDRSFLGYRLLQEYFCFPEKFLFFDLCALDSTSSLARSGAFEVVVFFRHSEVRSRLSSIAQAVSAETFQLGCTPVVNLFEHSADTIRISHRVPEYLVIPDRLRMASLEVYSVDRVASNAIHGGKPITYEPFFSFRHARNDQHARCFWYAHRRPTTRKDVDGTDVYLSLVDLDFNPAAPPVEQVTPYVTCTNRDLVPQLEWRKQWGELGGEGLPEVQIRCITSPSPPVRSALRGSLEWRLLSHLSLNHLSILQAGGLEALQEILRLYVFTEDEETRRRIAGITELKSEADVNPVLFPSGIAFCRGLNVQLEFDESQYAGSGVFLLGAVLERFVGLYSAVNSYTRLAIRSQQRTGLIKQWPVRIGQQGVL